MDLTQLISDHNFTDGDLSTGGYVAAVAAFQKFYISDGRPYDDSINDSGYHKLDMVNTRIRCTTDPSWSAGDVMTQGDIKGVFDEIIDNGDGTYDIMVYRTTATQFVTDVNIDVTGEASLVAGDITAVAAPPYWLNWVPSAGSFPDGGSNVMCLYNGRIFMNDMYHPNQWYCTRQGDPLDLDTSQDDIGAPTSSQVANAGKVGDSITAFIPYKDHYLIFGCASEIWILRGDPAQGGTLSNLTYEDGLFSPDSWTWDNEGNLYFVGLNGFYKLPIGAGTENVGAKNITENIYPSLFKTIKPNRRTDRALVEFDKERNGINVSIGLKDGTWSVSWFYDLKTGGMFPEQYSANAVPSSMLYYDSSMFDDRGLLFGSDDGYIRIFDEEAKNDDDGFSDVTIDSYVFLGPIQLKEAEARASLAMNDLQIDLSEDTDGLDWELYAADSAEALVKGVEEGTLTAVATGTFTSGGHQNSIRKKVRGRFIGIMLNNDDASESWALEGIEIDISFAGQSKRS